MRFLSFNQNQYLLEYTSRFKKAIKKSGPMINGTGYYQTVNISSRY